MIYLFQEALVYASPSFKAKKKFTVHQVLPIDKYFVIEQLESSTDECTRWTVNNSQKNVELYTESQRERDAWLIHFRKYSKAEKQRVSSLQHTNSTLSEKERLLINALNGGDIHSVSIGTSLVFGSAPASNLRPTVELTSVTELTSVDEDEELALESKDES